MRWLATPLSLKTCVGLIASTSSSMHGLDPPLHSSEIPAQISHCYCCIQEHYMIAGQRPLIECVEKLLHSPMVLDIIGDNAHLCWGGQHSTSATHNGVIKLLGPHEIGDSGSPIFIMYEIRDPAHTIRMHRWAGLLSCLQSTQMLSKDSLYIYVCVSQCVSV